MKLFHSLKTLFAEEGFVRIRRYICRPALTTAAIAAGLTLIVLIVLIATSRLDDIIVSLNMRYDSPALIFLGVSFLVVQIGALGYGVFLSLRKYHRYGSGKKGIINVTYPKGNSYKALHSTLNK